MTIRRFLVLALLAGVVLAARPAIVPVGLPALAATDTLPARLTNQQFWKLVTDFSEPDGTFHSENLVSNEARFQFVIPALVRTARPGRVYMGVGSEQNFTYIAAVRPEMVFIVDIRRGNLDLHLAYKALFELSASRADFVSRLFSRKQPAGLGRSSTAAEIFSAYADVPASQALYEQNLKAIEHQLLTRHGFALSKGDLAGLAFVYDAWFSDGPDIRYRLNGGFGGRSSSPTYGDLMMATDGAGRGRSYLASEEAFSFVKDLQTRNMLVPVVGNFAGPKAIRSVAAYLKQHDAVVSAFYLSNVEQYLRRDAVEDRFCANAATLPMDESSTFIRSIRGGLGAGRTFGPGFTSELQPMREALAAGCPAAR